MDKLFLNVESLPNPNIAHRDPEPQRCAEPLLGANVPTANAPCWKPALRFMERAERGMDAHSMYPGRTVAKPRSRQNPRSFWD